MRLLLTIAAILYAPTVTPEQSWSGWHPWMFGQPCSTATDRLELAGKDGGCMDVVLTEPKWMKSRKRINKFSAYNRR